MPHGRDARAPTTRLIARAMGVPNRSMWDSRSRTVAKGLNVTGRGYADSGNTTSRMERNTTNPNRTPARSGQRTVRGKRQATAANKAAQISERPKWHAIPRADVATPPENAALPSRPLAMAWNTTCGAAPLAPANEMANRRSSAPPISPPNRIAFGNALTREDETRIRIDSPHTASRPCTLKPSRTATPRYRTRRQGLTRQHERSAAIPHPARDRSR